MEKRASYPCDKRLHPPIRSSTVRELKGIKIADSEKLATSILDNISQTNLRSWVKFLSSFHTRHTKSIFINLVADWIRSQLLSFGYSDVYYNEYTRQGYSLRNIVCSKKGKNDRNIIVCAHYDCIMQDPENFEKRAPGANDNASGVSVLLEVSRILNKIDLDLNIQFVFFSGEEQGLWGSEEYARYMKENKIDVYRLINLDMVGSPPGDNKKVIVEFDMGNKISINDRDSENFACVMEEMALKYTDLKVTKGPIYSSDYMPFEALGYTVIGLYDEGELNSYYHSENDLFCNINFDYLTSITKMVLSTLITLCDRN